MNRPSGLLFFVQLAGAAVVLHAARPAEARPAAVRPAAALQQVQIPYVMRDAMGNNWDVQQDGRIGDGGNNIYDGGGKLFLGADNTQWVLPQAQAGFDAAANEVVLGPVQIQGLNVTRRISVNVGQNWCRWVEVLENPGPAPLRTAVHVNFTTGGQIATSHDFVDDKKTHKNVGVAVFDGNHSLAMVGAGRGAKVVPHITCQVNTDLVDFVWDVEVPAKQTVAIAHFQVARPSIADASAFWDSAREKELIAGIPSDLARVLVNFPHAEKLVNDLEILRGGLLDVVELRGGDQWRGTLKDASYKIDTFCGPIELPAAQIAGMVTVGYFRPVQLFVTADGEVFGGALQADSIKLQLTSGQITSIPLHSVTRLGYRKRPGEPDEWQFDRPTAFLRDGQRIGVQMPDEAIAVSTVYGTLNLKPESIAALIFQSEDQPVHQVLLADGSRFAGLVVRESFDLGIRNPAVGGPDGVKAGTFSGPRAVSGSVFPALPAGRGPASASAAAKTFAFQASSLARLQLSPNPGESGEDTPSLTATNGDLLIGTLAGQLDLETGFDTIRINGAEVRALSHATPDGVPAGSSAARSSPTEVQVTLWDDATLSGRLKGDAVAFTLKSGIQVKMPVALIEQYTQPEPQPSQEVLDRIKAIVTELADPDWKRRDRAADRLREIGPSVGSILKKLKASQPPEAQKQIDAILKGLEEARKAREQQIVRVQPVVNENAPPVPGAPNVPPPNPPAPPQEHD